MRLLEASLKQTDVKSMKKTSASDADFSELITEDCTVSLNGEIKIVYLTNLKSPAMQATRRAVQTIKTIPETRTGGLSTNSRIFGYAPRNPLRNHACRATSMAREYPGEHNAICSAAPYVNEIYAKYFPARHDLHAKKLKELSPEWHIANSVFTSGIVNSNNPLQYHFDAGNINHVCSAMLGFRHKTKGGHLSCPEFDIGFQIADNSLILFDGQSILHGVTPIIKTTKDSFRYTIVYYSLKQMWSCDTFENEVDRLRKIRTAIEIKRSKATR